MSHSKKVRKAYQQWERENDEVGGIYYNLSADDPCPDCGELRNENGFCNCPESWKC